MSNAHASGTSPKSPTPRPSRKEKAQAEGAARSNDRLIHESPDYHSCKREFGAAAMSGNPKGEWTCTVRHDPKRMLKAEQMLGGIRKEQSRRGRQFREEQDKEPVYLNGTRHDYPEHLVPNLTKKHKHVRGIGRSGKAPTEYHSMVGASPLYERGPDGLYFVWNDGWEPVNFWRNGALSPQRDPDLNVWVEAEGEWSLMDEVN